MVGEGVGWLIGAKSGAKQNLQQMRDQERQHISRYLMTLLADSQKEHSHSLTKTIKGLERAMRDDLVDKIKREKHSRERSLKSFQEARNLTAADANARIALLY
jgi:formate dehydrogenase maturation protein FdhE